MLGFYCDHFNTVEVSNSFYNQPSGSTLKSLHDTSNGSFQFSWFNDEVLNLVTDHNIALCMYELAGQKSPKEITADFIYIRLHGPGDTYEGEYGKKGLAGWVGSIQNWQTQVNDIYCYFDNDQNGYAARDARALQEMI